ncbi:hypothetical protein UYSO10_1748 [Kosakonia radicincitans]|nr:hypothetical protein UYSO10_1748 [Kosakonia radicincitans]
MPALSAIALFKDKNIFSCFLQTLWQHKKLDNCNKYGN